MSRRNRRSPRSFSNVATHVSLSTEAMELRQVMSATTSSLIPAATKEITVTAEYILPNPGYRLEIDAVVVKDNTVHVFPRSIRQRQILSGPKSSRLLKSH